MSRPPATPIEWLAHLDQGVLRAELRWTLRWMFAGWGAAWLVFFLALRAGQVFLVASFGDSLLQAGDWLSETAGRRPAALLIGVAANVDRLFVFWIALAVPTRLRALGADGDRSPDRPQGEAWPGRLVAPWLFALTLRSLWSLRLAILPFLSENPFALQGADPLGWDDAATWLLDAAILIWLAPFAVWIARPRSGWAAALAATISGGVMACAAIGLTVMTVFQIAARIDSTAPEFIQRHEVGVACAMAVVFIAILLLLARFTIARLRRDGD